MVLQTYLKQHNKYYATGNATEYTYRAVLQYLFETTLSEIAVTNE